MKIIRSIYNPKIIFPNEILLVYKDIGETSHDIVNQTRKIKQTRKVGHSGVLDPFAEGLMLVGVNNGTKEIWKYDDQTKEYEFEMVLGVQTLSGDHQDRILNLSNIKITKNEKEILDALNQFKGKYEQKVPILSNVKVNGQKLRELTRASKDIVFNDKKVKFISEHQEIEIEIPTREVEIFEISLISFSFLHSNDLLQNASDVFKEDFKKSFPNLDQEFLCIKVRTSVSKGTYIRMLNEDIAKELNTFGTLISLKRTKIGEFNNT